MLIKELSPGDVWALRRRADGERRAEQKDRLMAAVPAVEGMETADIQRVLGRSRGFVQRWAYAYRDGGIDAVIDKPRGGKLAKLSGENLVRLKARIDAGPTAADRVCTLRGKDIQRIARDELNTGVSLSSVYRTLEQMGYSSLAPRPRHEKQDPAAQEKFKRESAPHFVKTVGEALSPHGVTVRVFIMDEARLGQQGTLTRMWAPKGSRPTGVKQTRYEWVYLYAAVEPATGASVALQAPEVNTDTMNVFLGMVSAELGPKEHAVLIMDGAGWHKSKKPAVPENITILILPPYSPEPNPVERLWAYLRSHYLANRVYDDYQHLLDAGAEAWQQLTPKIFSSVCACDYITHEVES